MQRERTSRRVIVHEVEPARLLASTARHPNHQFWIDRVSSAETGEVVAGCRADVSGRWVRTERGAPPTLVACESLRVCLDATPEQALAVFREWFDAQGFDREEIARKAGE